MEEDTYRPYVGLEMQSVGTEDNKEISIVDENEVETEPSED